MLNLFKKDPRDRIVKHIQKKFSQKNSTILIENLTPCFVLDNEKSPKLKIGISKQSGYPDLPRDFSWPQYNGKKLDFILQLNLEEFNGEEIGLPQKGMLYFFMDLASEELPKETNQYKVIYISTWEELHTQAYDKSNTVEEKTLTINESLTFPESQSYLLMDTELTDEEFDELINLDYPIVSELFGGGIYDVGKLANSEVIDEWVEEFNKQNVTQLKPEESTNNFVGLLSFLLDEWGFPDSWVHFGLEKEELKKGEFNKTKISFTFT